MSDQNNDRPVSPLRQRMIEDMTIRQFGEKTKRDYVRLVRDFAAFLARSPDLPAQLRGIPQSLLDFRTPRVARHTCLCPARIGWGLCYPAA